MLVTTPTMKIKLTTIFLLFAFYFTAFSEDLTEAYKKQFAPLPAVSTSQTNDAKVKLGKKLYLDPKLSINDTISCNSCHGLDTFGVDNNPVSSGHDGSKGERNSPTVYNAALHFLQFWDGRAKDVEEQALGPILNPIEMGMPAEEDVVNKLKKDKEYTALFKAAFPEERDPLTYQNIGQAIGAFERTLLTPSRFDDFLKGSENSLNDAEVRGFKAFVENGCTVCHNGVGLGGNSFQKLGLVIPYETKDKGKAEVTKNAADNYFFKVPSLRNITKTAPYFHDGSVKDLKEAIRLMAKHQLGKDLTAEDIESIATFLQSLTAKELPSS